eukprot:g4658.t1
MEEATPAFCSGSGRTLSISREAIAKAEEMMSSCLGPKSSKMKFRTPHIEKSTSSDSVGSMFSTGTGRKLSVSVSALAKASNLLSEDVKKHVPLQSNCSKFRTPALQQKGKSKFPLPPRTSKSTTGTRRKYSYPNSSFRTPASALTLSSESVSKVQSEPLRRRNKRIKESTSKRGSNSLLRNMKSKRNVQWQPPRRPAVGKTVSTIRKRRFSPPRMTNVIEQKPRAKIAKLSPSCSVKKSKHLHLDKTSAATYLSERTLSNRIELHNFMNGCAPCTRVSSSTYLRNLGVSLILENLTCENAAYILFDIEGKPSALSGIGGDSNRSTNSCGELADWTFLRRDLLRSGAEAKFATSVWVRNHFRWIVWKLACYERTYPKRFAGNALTYSRVLEQLRYRYDCEIQRGKRPALRRILAGDAHAGRLLVLCVSEVITMEKPVSANSAWENFSEENIGLVLTDGWYAVKASLDSFLQKLVRRGHIFVGKKLGVCSCKLVGCEEGIEALECAVYSGDSTTKSEPLLQLHYNGVVGARWDAKLGFQKKPRFDRPLSTVKAGGGEVPEVIAIIERCWPVRIMETTSDGQKIFRSVEEEAEEQLHNAQKEEDARHRVRKSLQGGRSHDDGDAMLLDALDEDGSRGAKMAKEMILSGDNDSSSSWCSYDDHELAMQAVEKAKRRCNEMESKRVAAKFEKERPEVRKTCSMESYRLVEINRTGTSIDGCDDSIVTWRRRRCKLTVWGSYRGADALGAYQEGQVIRLLRASSRKTYLTDDGLLNMELSRSGRMEAYLKVEDEFSHALYRPRTYVPLEENVDDKEQCGDFEQGFDTVGVVLHVSQHAVWFTDGPRGQGTAILDAEGKIDGTKRSHRSGFKGRGWAKVGAIVAFTDLRRFRYDAKQKVHHCIWSDLTVASSKKTGKHLKCVMDEVREWKKTPEGKRRIEKESERIEAILSGKMCEAEESEADVDPVVALSFGSFDGDDDIGEAFYEAAMLEVAKVESMEAISGAATVKREPSRVEEISSVEAKLDMGNKVPAKSRFTKTRKKAQLLSSSKSPSSSTSYKVPMKAQNVGQSFGFQTGSGRAVTVSEKALAEAAKLLAEEERKL